MKIELKKKSYWDVAMKTDMDDKYPGKKRMIQALTDIYPIVESYDNDSAAINKNSDVSDIFPCFLEMIEKSLDNPSQQTIINYHKKYVLSVYSYHDISDSTLYAMPISFLPFLEINNKKLHDIVVDALRLMEEKKVFICCSPYEDMMEEQIDRAMMKDEDYDIDCSEDFEWEYNYKEKYERKYLRMFCNPCDVNKLERRVKKYHIEFPGEEYLIEFVMMLIRAYREPYDMTFFTNQAIETFIDINEMEHNANGSCDFNDGQPVVPNECVIFTWFKEEWINNHMASWLGESGDNFGEASFSQEMQCHTVEDLKSVKAGFLAKFGHFPEYLVKAIIYGKDHEEEIYEYAKGQLSLNLYKENARK